MSEIPTPAELAAMWSDLPVIGYAQWAIKYGPRLLAAVEALQAWVNDLQAGMYVNCVYCGHRYGPDNEVPVAMADVLKAHVEQCPAHPMSALRADLTAVQEERDAAEGREATLTDLANSWARESRVPEAKRPEDAKELIDRLWAHWSGENHGLRTQLDAVRAELDGWKSGAMADATGHMLRCARVNGAWACAEGCAVARLAAVEGAARAVCDSIADGRVWHWLNLDDEQLAALQRLAEVVLPAPEAGPAREESQQ